MAQDRRKRNTAVPKKSRLYGAKRRPQFALPQDDPAVKGLIRSDRASFIRFSQRDPQGGRRKHAYFLNRRKGPADRRKKDLGMVARKKPPFEKERQ